MGDVTKIGQGDFGARLRAARERQDISLRQIAASTKIAVSTLEALEANDVSGLPGGIFTARVRSLVCVRRRARPRTGGT